MEGPPPPLERFWNQVVKTNTCWFWTGTIHLLGYGRVRWMGRQRQAHAVAYELLGGIIPEGMEIDHLCRNRACVNPTHLEPVTHHTNVLRGEAGKYLAKRTHCKRGHPFDLLNTRFDKRGSRICRTCMRDYQKRYFQVHGHRVTNAARQR